MKPTKTIRSWLVLLLATLALTLTTVGCKNPNATQVIAQQTTFVGARIAMQQAPSAKPYIAAAAPVICNAAHSTNATPSQVSADLSNLSTADQTGVLIMNSLLSIWFAAYDSQDPNAQAALLGVCDGLNMALALGAKPLGFRYVQPRH